MPKFYDLQPEVAGRVAPGTVYDHSVWPPRLSQLRYEFADWFGDAIVESYPCFLATQTLAAKIHKMQLTGANSDHVIVSTSLEFHDSRLRKRTGELPNFVWLKVGWKPFADDFGLDLKDEAEGRKSYRLIVSERALKLLQVCGFKHGVIRSVIEV